MILIRIWIQISILNAIYIENHHFGRLFDIIQTFRLNNQHLVNLNQSFNQFYIEKVRFYQKLVEFNQKRQPKLTILAQIRPIFDIN